MSVRAVDVLEELAALCSEFPNAADEMPLQELAACFRCSPEAVEVAEFLEQPPLRIEADEVVVPPAVGTLAEWRREVARQLRKVTDLDALSIAACHEMDALDELRAGMLKAARQSRIAAAKIVVEAAIARESKAA